MQNSKFPNGSIVTSIKTGETGVLVKFNPGTKKCTLNREDGSSFEEHESHCVLSKEDEFYNGYPEVESLTQGE